MARPVPDDPHRAASLGDIGKSVIAPEAAYVAIRAVVIQLIFRINAPRIVVSSLEVVSPDEVPDPLG